MNVRTMAANLLVLGALLSVTGCGGKQETTTAAGQPVVVSGVTVAPAVAATLPEGIEAVGTVKAKNSAVLAARLPATVTGVFVRDGEAVGKGKLLVTLEAGESSAQAASATAAAEEAARGLDEARARKRLADATYERYNNLFKEQAVTRQELDNRKADKEVADQGVQRAIARLAASRDAARAASVVAGYQRIVSPLAGTVTAKQVERGMTVFPGTPLLTVEGDGDFRLEVAVPESQIDRVKIGARLPVTIESAGLALDGRVAEVVPSADPGSRTFTVKVDVAGKGLKSGMFGRMVLPTGERSGIVVAKAAVVERGALTSVWVVDQQGTARMRLVKVGKMFGDRVEILSGLTAGERLVVGGADRVVEGARIR
ncbi:RND transporter [Geotalea uraniireducens]|uniref:RND transporter n=1 Tax=Geotalea uraniireducens TaxID=351604 RepID=A0ABM8EGP4_9BACT|nr:efflux RND transporter periplasmic adaptor subunit [Geotalea uraniireducens]BDV41430.1 RND transporter [Geotalea uraniireducens]